MESILTSIKKLLGLEASYTQFDTDIIIFINSALSILNQLGVGPTEGFTIADSSAVWSTFIGTRKDIENVKTYVYLHVRLLFDPPQTGYLVDAIKTQAIELSWRIMNQVDEPIEE